MTKFNRQTSVAADLANRPDATVNFEGGLAFELTPLTRLYTRVMSTFVAEKTFYQSAQDHDAGLLEDIKLVAAVDPEFVLRLAAYARQVMYMRSVSVVLLAEAAAIPQCKPFVRKWTPQILQRADELSEVIGYWVKRHGSIGDKGEAGGMHAFPKSLSKGIADALYSFDEYQFAKYDRKKRAVTFRDMLRIVRPKPKTEKHSALFRYLVKGELNPELLPLLAAKHALLRKETFDDEAKELARKSHATWEVLTSKFGSRAEVWNALNLPYMAALRNLRNLLEKGAELDKVLAMIADPERVKYSKQLPFRFLSAFREVEKLQHPQVQQVLKAVSLALEASVVNLPRLPGVSFITMDNSASMNGTLSEKSSVTCKDVANLLGSIAHTMCDQAVTSVFGTYHKVVNVNPCDSIITNMRRFAKTDVEHATHAFEAVRHLRRTNTRVDRIILFSDMQCYIPLHRGRQTSLAVELERYRHQVNPRVVLYSVDLAGYGTAQFCESDQKVATLAGWSDKLLSFIPLFEEDGVQAVTRIRSWSPKVN